MKKGILSFSASLVIVLSAFWFWQPSTPQNLASGELSKKEYAIEPIELPTEMAMSDEAVNVEKEPKGKVQTVTTVYQPQGDQPTKGDFLKAAESFIDKIVQPTSEQHKVQTFKDKEQLVDHLNQYAASDVARYYVDGLYEEKNGQLYMIPTELPPWIVMGEPTKLAKINDDHYTLTQENTTDHYGNYQIKLSFSQQGEKWIINDVQYTYK
ncbi:hypothetical protein [Pseudalkalibacillus decolorationis]|uniref:hypothetical protein n=1 Tax=Pseudalkalibacillus decolorationis TaxID=163879 RepID=UPI002148EFB0|nr:hypothetical protein [Pseudalkalibacillus decolorationis]